MSPHEEKSPPPAGFFLPRRPKSEYPRLQRGDGGGDGLFAAGIQQTNVWSADPTDANGDGLFAAEAAPTEAPGLEAAGLVIVDGLDDFGLRVHHEWTVAGDWLANWLAGDQDELALRAEAAEAHGIALAEN